MSCWTNVPLSAETTHPYDAGKKISPVYEEMLANQIYSLWRDLVLKNSVLEKEPFYIQSDGDEVAATDLSSILKKRFPFVDWRKEPFHDSQFGILIIRNAERFGISHVGNWRGYVLVFAHDSSDEKLALEKIGAQGFQVHSELSLFELEYVKNEKGRQMVNFDDPDSAHPVFERLVREGMNPVYAHTAADEALKDFRKLKEPKLLIFVKITAS